MRRLLLVVAAAVLLVAGLPVTAWASPAEDVCSVEILGWRAC